MKSSNRMITHVVAAPGYQSLLNIGGTKVIITAFKAVNLAEMFSKEDIIACTGLNESIAQGYIVKYTGQTLPIDPNAQYVGELAHAAAQHIQTNYNQVGSKLDKNTQVVTNPDLMTPEFKQDLLDKVEKSKMKILATDNSLLRRTNDSYEDVDKDPVERKNPLTANELTMKVSLDIPVDKFTAKQKAEAEQFAKMREDSPLPTKGVSPVPSRANSATNNDDEN